MLLYEIYREDGGNGITFVHMLYYQMSVLQKKSMLSTLIYEEGKSLYRLQLTRFKIEIMEVL